LVPVVKTIYYLVRNKTKILQTPEPLKQKYRMQSLMLHPVLNHKTETQIKTQKKAQAKKVK
jgi:hypothetical protein